MHPSLRIAATALVLTAAVVALAVRSGASQDVDRVQRSRALDEQGTAEPFRGVTTDGNVEGDLFHVRSTGVSTAPVKEAADAFLASLTVEQRQRTTFAPDDNEWRQWMNQHFYARLGVGFDEMDAPQRDAALALMRASLSAEGLKLSRDIMKLNHTLGELNGDNLVEYGEWLYWITVMGEPSSTEPWGWQLDGHHLIINYFVLGDQVVMTPLFVGSEPVTAKSGKYAGTTILQAEQDAGLAMLRALSAAQRERAILSVDKEGNNNLGEAFKDNLVLDYAGVPAGSFDAAQRQQLLELIALYVDNLREPHARVWMQDVEAHLDRTWFAWIGGSDDDSVYYYRIHSPVLLIEFDHQRPANLRHLSESTAPNREHIHAVVRTPNGNDYGKDLLRQHYEMHAHD